MAFDPEMFGRAVGEQIAATVVPLVARIKTLEERLDGMQSKLDRTERRGLFFSGDWQEAASYGAGSIVKFGNSLFTAVKDVAPGGQPPVRRGSGWATLICGHGERE